MAKVSTYSKKKDGNILIRPNFRVKEFACKDGSDTVLLCEETVEILQAIRNYFGEPVVINSAYRTPAYNKKVGGATKSQHVVGTACDIHIANVPPAAIASYIEKYYPAHGVGLYSTFVHVDSRGYKVYWKDKGNNVVNTFGNGTLHEKYKKATAPVTTVQPSSGLENTEEFKAAIALGITDGTRPGDTATRAETAIMVLRAYRKAINVLGR